jgi:threonine synthase
VFAAASLDDDATLAVIARLHRRTGYLADPHTAVGIGAAEMCRRRPDLPMVCLATAHPAKFPDAVERATGTRPVLPDSLADLFQRPERYDVVSPDVDAVRRYVEGVVKGH